MLGADGTLGLVAGTLALFTGLGVWYTRGRIGSAEDLITARNSTGAGRTAATLIATGMGAWMLFTPAEAGASFGGLSALLGYTVGAVLGSLVYIPLGVRIRQLIPEGHALTEYVYVRFGSRMYVFVLAVTFGYLFLVLSSGMTGITTALSIVGGVPPWQTAVVIGVSVVGYTAYGGLVASIFTDALQSLLILPLLVASTVAAVFAAGGAGELYSRVGTAEPALLDPFLLPGLEFGLYSSIGVVAVTIFHQGYWQRVYAAANGSVVKRGFGVAAIASVPMVLLPGLFGLMAVGLGLVGDSGEASIALFLVLEAVLPEWVAIAVILLAVLLVMSTADTLLNAIASIFVSDLSLLTEVDRPQRLATVGRLATVLAGIGAVAVGIQGYSVLALLLLANLLATSTAIPFVLGLYTGRIGEAHALVASGIGLAAGLLLFPISNGFIATVPGASAWLPTPSFLAAYLAAAILSGGIAGGLAFLAPQEFDLDRLSTEIRSLDAAGEGS